MESSKRLNCRCERTRVCAVVGLGASPKKP